ncbi:MAG: hypothetical protein KUL82_05195 [Bdellovibrio sp.]|uniref:hypothetical protein n=1 Tax=Bdellovibrio sp. TaxID=28201 RepID=UPI0039E2B938|nr:hypothetical protein [Bdellovibrio sp.]
MEHLNKTALILMIFFGPLGCGVKGRPLPPLNPAPLGRGEPTYKESTQKKPAKKSNPQVDSNENFGDETEEP